MFSAAPADASLVETATRIGRPLRKWLLAAIVIGVSAMLCASFANVFPVQGAIIRASSSFLGPIGSTAAMLHSGDLPQIAVAFCICDSAVPKRLSILPVAPEKIGITVSFFAIDSITGKTESNVQNEPHIANPMFIPLLLSDAHLTESKNAVGN